MGAIKKNINSHPERNDTIRFAVRIIRTHEI